MEIFIEIVSVLWQTISGLISAFVTVIWDNLSTILEIKKIMGYFTPVGMVALYLGVPTIVVTIAIKLIKKLVAEK